MNIEEVIEPGRYTVRAELPGLDPAHQIDVTVNDGVLTIKASFNVATRSLILPAGADISTATAIYNAGILTVSIPVSGSSDKKRHIQVRSGSPGEEPALKDEAWTI